MRAIMGMLLVENVPIAYHKAMTLAMTHSFLGYNSGGKERVWEIEGQETGQPIEERLLTHSDALGQRYRLRFWRCTQLLFEAFSRSLVVSQRLSGPA